MKQMNILVSVILVAAVLIAAYAVGLLVKQSRTPEPQAQSQEQQVSEPNETPDGNQPIAPNVPKTRPGRAELSQEERAKIKQERLAKLADANNMTEEDKAQRQDEIRERLLRKSKDLPNMETLTAEEKAWVRENWAGLSADQRTNMSKLIQKIKAMQETNPDANATSSENPAGEEAKTSTSEPNATTTQ